MKAYFFRKVVRKKKITEMLKNKNHKSYEECRKIPFQSNAFSQILNYAIVSTSNERISASYSNIFSWGTKKWKLFLPEKCANKSFAKQVKIKKNHQNGIDIRHKQT